MSSLEALTQEVKELRRRVEDAEAVLEIQNLKGRYAQLVDARFARGKVLDAGPLDEVAREIASLFTEDGIWDAGPPLGVAEGRAAIAERMRKPSLRFSWHYFLKPRIHVDGDRATARWDILSPCTTKDGAPHWMAGFEDDEYVRVNGVWLHRRMKLTSVFMAPHETGWEKIYF